MNRQQRKAWRDHYLAVIPTTVLMADSADEAVAVANDLATRGLAAETSFAGSEDADRLRILEARNANLSESVRLLGNLLHTRETAINDLDSDLRRVKAEAHEQATRAQNAERALEQVQDELATLRAQHETPPATEGGAQAELDAVGHFVVVHGGSDDDAR